jgi:DNA replication protein DnaC
MALQKIPQVGETLLSKRFSELSVEERKHLPEIMVERSRRRREAQMEAFYAGGGTCFECRDHEGAACEYCERGQAVMDAMFEQNIDEIVRTSGLPSRYQQHTFESYPGDKTPSVAAFEDFARDWTPDQSAVIYGKYGVGKTGLVAAGIRRAAEEFATTERLKPHQERRAIRFVTATGFTDDLRRGYNDGTFAESMDLAQRCGLLVIDDLGSEKSSEWVRERLFAVVDYRYGNRKGTWVTTNVPPKQLPKQIGERLFWRLIEDGELFEIDGQNLRAVKDRSAT